MANDAAAPKKGFAKIGQFLKEVRLEMKKITWPTHKNAFKSFMLVIATVVFCAAVLYGFDRLLLLLAGVIAGS